MINPNAKLNRKLLKEDIEQVPTWFGYGDEAEKALRQLRTLRGKIKNENE